MRFNKDTDNESRQTRTGLGGGAIATYAVFAPFTQKDAQGPARAVDRNICPVVNYICLNCKEEFTKGPDM